jgi:hypothetical protein
VFAYLRERVRNKIKGWKAKLLSRSGKKILLKYVVQSMQTYAMSVFLPPKSLCEKIQRMMNAFWWTSSRDKGLKWISWEKLCVHKKFGVMGFRLLHEFNLALLAKLGWRILSCPNSLLARVFKAKYLRNRSFWEVGTSKNASFVWRGILRARSVLEKGMRWRIGSGREIRVWNDKWIPKGRDIKVHSPIIEEFRDLRVSDLIIEERGRRK